MNRRSIAREATDRRRTGYSLAMTENPYQPPTTPAERPTTEDASQPTADGSIAYGVMVRSLGLASLLYGAWSVSFAFMYAAGVPEANEGEKQLTFAGGMFLVLVGLMLLGFAPLVVRLSYPHSR